MSVLHLATREATICKRTNARNVTTRLSAVTCRNCDKGRGRMIPLEHTSPPLRDNPINQRQSPEAARDSGIAAREHHSDPRLVLAVDAVIDRWISSGRRFSANEIRDEVPTLASGLVGGRLMSAYMRGDIVKVGEVRSTLLSTRAKKIGTWVRADLHRSATQSARAAS